MNLRGVGLEKGEDVYGAARAIIESHGKPVALDLVCEIVTFQSIGRVYFGSDFDAFCKELFS